MPQNVNQLNYGGQMFNIDDVIKGQTPLTMYDSLKQIALQPSIRRSASGMVSAVLPYPETSIWGLFAQLMSHLGTDSRTVNSREFYQAEYTNVGSYAFAVNKTNTSPATSITTTVSRASLAQSGIFAKPLSGYKGIIKEAGHQNVNITSVVPVSSGNFNITFSSINGELIDLRNRSQFTVILYMMRTYDLSSTNQIRTQGIVGNPPLLRKAFVEKYEQGLEVDESEIDNYVYTKDFTIAKGLDGNGNQIDYFYSPFLTRKAEEWINLNRCLRTVLSERDYTTNQDFDGLKPTIEKYGMFDFAYDSFMTGSFKSLLFAMIKSIRKVNGSKEYMLLHDFNFGFDFSEQIAALVKSTGQNLNFSLFGAGGMGLQTDFEYFAFQNFKWANYKFMTYQMDFMDSNMLGRPLEYFAFLIPATTTVDTEGNRVPAMTYVNLAGAEPAKSKNVWVDDARMRGERGLRVFVKDNFGCEFHLPSYMGMIRKAV